MGLLGVVASVLKIVLFIVDYIIFNVLYLIKGNAILPLDLQHKRRKMGAQVPGSNPPIYRNIESMEKLQDTFVPGVHTVNGLLSHAIKQYGNKKMLGQRKILSIEQNGKFQTYHLDDLKWQTFDEVNKRIDDLATGIVEFAGLKSGDRLGIFANTSQEWYMIAHACLRQNITLVTVYASLGEDSLVHSLNQTEITCLLTDEVLLPKFKTVAKQVPTLKHVIYVPEKKECDTAAAEAIGKQAGLKVFSSEQIEELGHSASKKATAQEEAKPETVALIMYTSGTTGIPKGVIITHRAIVAACTGIHNGLELRPQDERVLLGYLPLAHILEFVAENTIICTGGCVGYGTNRTLMDTSAKPFGDFTAVRPTLFAGVPRVFDTIKKGIEETIQNPKSSSPIVRFLFETAMSHKKAALEAGRETPLWNFLVFNKLKKRLGGKVFVCLSGGAALNKQTQEFIRLAFGVSTVQGYGLTESCAALAVGSIRQPLRVAAAGNLTTSVEIKLDSVPEMGYTSDDKPYPRGEICVRGPSLSSGYYKDEKKTKEDFKSDGWFHTGDIGQFDENGILSIVDRKKNLVKLDMGEYVALEKLETVYGNSPFVSPNGICCYADSSVSSVTGLVLPQVNYCKRYAAENGISYDESDLNTLFTAIKKPVLEALIAEGKKAKLSHHEMITNITLLNDEWTPENDLLTAAMKLKRPTINKKYETVIKAMYPKKN